MTLLAAVGVCVLCRSRHVVFSLIASTACQHSMRASGSDLCLDVARGLTHVRSLSLSWCSFLLGQQSPKEVCHPAGQERRKRDISRPATEDSEEQWDEEEWEWEEEQTWFEAIVSGDLSAAQQILETREVSWVDSTDDEFDPLDGRGRTALQEASLAGHISVVQWLLEERANVQHADYWDGYTPLHEAAISGSTEVVSCLLAARASMEQKCLTDLKATPLQYAAREGHAEVCQMLLKSGADPSVLEE